MIHGSDMARLMESRNDIDKCRSVYDRAVKNVPTVAEKRFWRRYVYLWIYYAVFEELVANDRVRTRAVYLEALGKFPQKVHLCKALDLLRPVRGSLQRCLVCTQDARCCLGQMPKA